MVTPPTLTSDSSDSSHCELKPNTHERERWVDPQADPPNSKNRLGGTTHWQDHVQPLGLFPEPVRTVTVPVASIV